jgi:hypothetical protein
MTSQKWNRSTITILQRIIEKSQPKIHRLAFCYVALLLLLGLLNPDFNHYTAIGLQAFNQLPVLAADLALDVIAGDNRLGFTFGRSFDAIVFNTLASQVSLHGICSTLG